MWNGNGNGHHHGENGNGDDNRNDAQSNDPARFAAVSALAAFSQGATQSYPAQPYAFQNQQQHPHSAHPMHHANPQQQQQQYSREELEYNRQMAERHDADQYQRMQQGQQLQHQQQQQQQWGNDQPPNGTTQQHSRPSSEPDSDEDNNVAVAADPVDDGTDDDDDEPEEAVATMEHDDDAMDAEGEEADDNSDTGSVQKPAAIVPRGKPEAMAVKLAAAAMEETREDLEAETGGQESDAEVVAEVEGEAEALIDESDAVVVAKVEKPKPNRSRSIPKKSRKKAPPPASERTELLLTESTPGITDEEYENLEALMIQFCRVPLLAEFSRPVTLLHPELVAAYSKIVTRPLDLGHVCRGVRRRQYKSTRDIRLDMWRVFANCVKFHSHPNNKEAVPSFVSIALHLREFFNFLWQEYMVPSDPVESASSVQKKAFARREKDRKKRFENLRVLCLSKKFMYKMAMRLNYFVEGGGLVDKLDTEPIFGEECMEPDRDLDVIVENLKQFQVKLEEMSLQAVEEDYTFEFFDQDIKRCYQHEVLEDNPSLRLRIGYRLNRFIGKFLIPICEANSRGVTQSSIWGNIAAVIWARESSKKPYWPALCLGMLPPDDQREDWHAAITERNESRLPEKLNAQLMTTKKKCEQAQKRQSLSYFLVEFLGTHEFIWVRETDIVEKFDPLDDPNKNASHAPKKKRTSRSSSTSIVGSKTYATALEECGWAQEEYESTLTDAFDDACNDNKEEEDDDEEEMNYSFALLAQSDDEADDEDGDEFRYDESSMSLEDVDEANWLLTHEGKLDTSVAGRKNTKKRTLALKKKTAVKEKKVQVETAKKAKVSPAKKKTKVKAKATKKDSRTKDREEKRETRDLEKRRRKRQREREKVLRVEARKQKRRRTPTYDSDDNDRGLNRDKRARATAIVKGYLTRAVNKDDYKSLGLAGVMTIPAAMVDSTGLLGMALAFRAAAGELNMPDENADDAKTKPWKAIDSESPKTSSDRAENLTKQIKLLEAEMERAENDAQKRKELAAEAVARRLATEVEITADDEAARQNHFKKKKKVPKIDHTSIDESLEKAGSAQHENGIEMTNGDATADGQKAQHDPSVAADETLETNDEEATAQAAPDEVDSEEVTADAEPADNDTPVVDN